MFYFVNNFPDQTDDVRTVCIKSTMSNMNELFDFYKTALEFPYPYSKETRYNYYAFHEIMMELDWLSEKEVRIIHDSLPPLKEDIMGDLYLDVLNLIDVEWEKRPECAEIFRQYAEKHPNRFISFDEGVRRWWKEKPKIFNVYFRKRDESFVKDILYQYSWDYRKCMQFDEKGHVDIKYTDRYSRDE